jgi:uroporphyrinogen-III synthase
MSLRALVTRPREDAEEVARDLRARGIEVLLAPMLSIAPVRDPAVDLGGVQAILFTSANGVRAFAAASSERGLPVLAVGDATAAAARKSGFANVESAAGDVASLADLAARRLNPATGALFHAAASVVAGDLAGILESKGFAVRRAVLYDAVPAKEFPADVVAALNENTLDIVLFFSPRSAATFVTLIDKSGLREACGHVAAFCLSPAVAKAIGSLPWRALRTASRPDWAAMRDEIETALQRGTG